MVFCTTQQTQYYSESSSSAASPVSNSATSAENHGHHQLAAEVPKKRTGRRVFRETRHPVYRGVRSRKGDKWVCEVREPVTGTRVWLGTYTNPEMAARAHDVAALAFRGKSACLNFADSAWRLPVPASTDQIDIRRAAAEAAEMFRPGAEAEAAAAEEQEYSTAAGETSHSDGDVFSYVEELEPVEELPKLLSEMAEGLLLSPPPPSYGAESDGWSYVERCGNDNNNDDYDWSLWHY
ncbi:unnamed protein product [Linum tenue]|uniref:AP2/ERF domain-containing protein n=1 Tax=Linum tenue TaxID=586396 RepID=A0AAV0JX44_9ROSI|nr:unnamed protein product [Linum tenue]